MTHFCRVSGISTSSSCSWSKFQAAGSWSGKSPWHAVQLLIKKGRTSKEYETSFSGSGSLELSFFESSRHATRMSRGEKRQSRRTPAAKANLLIRSIFPPRLIWHPLLIPNRRGTELFGINLQMPENYRESWTASGRPNSLS
jgi:hypothetical protein